MISLLPPTFDVCSLIPYHFAEFGHEVSASKALLNHRKSFIEIRAVLRHFEDAQPFWEINMATVGSYRFEVERACCR